MFLSIDVGNTNITLGIFENNILKNTFRLESDKNFSQLKYEELLLDLCKNFNIKTCAIASVVDELSQTIKKAVDNVFNIDSFLIDNNRIANAYGAKLKYTLPLIVVDIGTATTFDIVSKNNEFLGGVIMSGLNLQIKSLNINTSKLPKINIGMSEKVIGNSTEEALLSGIIRGSACAIEGLIKQCEEELGEKATIIATGGHSKLISEYMTRKFDYLDSNLTLEGIKKLYELNCP